MNISLNSLQSDTRSGDITLLSNSNLTGKENYLLKIVNNNGAPNFDLPSAITDQAFYICMSGGAQALDTTGQAPGLGENCRVFIDAACNPGDALALSKTNWGLLTKPATGYGSGYYTFLAEEAGVAGQSIKVRRIPDRATGAL